VTLPHNQPIAIIKEHCFEKQKAKKFLKPYFLTACSNLVDYQNMDKSLIK